MEANFCQCDDKKKNSKIFSETLRKFLNIFNIFGEIKFVIL